MATGTGVAVNGGGGDEREDGTEEMAGRCLTGEEGWEGEEGEERKGSELGGNKVSLIPSLFFRQPSFLMEIVLMEERISLQFFPLFSFFSLFFLPSFLLFFLSLLLPATNLLRFGYIVTQENGRRIGWRRVV